MAASETKLNKDGTPAKKRGSSGPRQAKPLYVVVTITGPDGAELNVNAQSGYKVNVRGTKDSAELVAILTGGAAANAAVVQAEMPEPARANPGDAPSA